MGEIVSVRLNEEESKFLRQVSALYGCGVSSLIKRLAFEKLEDEYDLQIIRDYEAEKAAGTLETIPYEEVRKSLGL
jgi:hypothetical protein